MLAATIIPGVLVGAALGLLGGGGSVLTVPIFVYVLGFAPKEAIAMSLAVVGATSALGALSHWRTGTVNIPVGIGFSTVAMLGTFLGVRLARFVPGEIQLVMFGAVVLTAAVFMLREQPSGDEASGRGPAPAGISVRKVVPGGLLVGLLTGLVGVGGGFQIVPALALMRMPLRKAVGTSLLVITGTCVVGFLGYLGDVPLNWTAMAFVAAGMLPGIMLGAYFHHFVPQAMLRRGFAAFLVVIAVFIVVENLGPLSAAWWEHEGLAKP